MSAYKDELRLALLFIEDVAKNDTHASARALGFLHGVEGRLGWRVSLNTIKARCELCGDFQEILSNGAPRSHFPKRAEYRYDSRNPRTYCRGRRAAPVVIATLTQSEASAEGNDADAGAA